MSAASSETDGSQDVFDKWTQTGISTTSRRRLVKNTHARAHGAAAGWHHHTSAHAAGWSVTWRIFTCGMTCLRVRHDAFICVTWRIHVSIHVCDMMHEHVWRVNCSYFRHEAFICAARLIRMTHPSRCCSHCRVTCLIYLCDMMHSSVWCDSLSAGGNLAQADQQLRILQKSQAPSFTGQPMQHHRLIVVGCCSGKKIKKAVALGSTQCVCDDSDAVTRMNELYYTSECVTHINDIICIRNATHQYVMHDAPTRQICLVHMSGIRMCDVTRSYVGLGACIRLMCLIYMCHVLYSYVWCGAHTVCRTAFICATWCICVRDLTRPYSRYDAFICHDVTSLSHTCDLTFFLYVWCHPYMQRYVFTRMTNCIHTCVVPRLYVCLEASTCVTPRFHMCYVTDPYSHCDWSHVSHGAFIRVMWRIDICAATLSCAERDSSTCETWRRWVQGHTWMCVWLFDTFVPAVTSSRVCVCVCECVCVCVCYKCVPKLLNLLFESISKRGL